MNDNIIICRSFAEDLQSIAALEGEVFPDPWKIEGLISSFENDNYIFLTAKNACGVLVGYAIGTSSFGEAELFRIASAPSERRLGIGRMLLEKFIDTVKERKDEKIFLEVRESNLPAITLYSSGGFEKYAVRNGYYKNPTENAVMMKLELCT